MNAPTRGKGWECVSEKTWIAKKAYLFVPEINRCHIEVGISGERCQLHGLINGLPKLGRQR